ncbi:MAG: restriction endonuclease [Candidatus Aenigmarchaeota archaeon]|nr:restriction endonuclease [Candidatus Aenigmarchaeota archaeon]
MLVKKADGSLENFDGDKIIRTCLRSGLSEGDAETVLQHVGKKAYDKIPTNVLLHIILKEIRKHSEPAAMRYSLRASLASLSPEGVFFELYVKKVLEEHGYVVEHSKITRGKCAEHEIDLIASKDGKKSMIECKHHKNHHTFAGLGEAMVTWAAFEDTAARNNFSDAWLVCSTKVSAHAQAYASCKNLKLMCWDNGLNEMVEGPKLYPVTIIGSMRDSSVERAFAAGLLTVRDVANANDETLRKVFGSNYKKAAGQAKEVIGS